MEVENINWNWAYCRRSTSWHSPWGSTMYHIICSTEESTCPPVLFYDITEIFLSGLFSRFQYQWQYLTLRALSECCVTSTATSNTDWFYYWANLTGKMALTDMLMSPYGSVDVVVNISHLLNVIMTFLNATGSQLARLVKLCLI